MSEPRYGWLVSYPRSGNTWLRFMIASLVEGGKDIDINHPGLAAPVANRNEFDDLLGIDSSLLTEDEVSTARPGWYREFARRFDGPLILRKVHDRCWRNRRGERMFPPELSRGAVYIVRDPRDVAVSYARFVDTDIDRMIRGMANPAMTIPLGQSYRLSQFPQPLGSWSEHVRSWLDDSDMPTHLIRYEDMIDDPAGALAGVAQFLGLDAAAAPAAAGAMRFSALRAQEEAHGFREMPLQETRFFRQGKAGGWRSVLSPAQAQRILDDHGDAMARLGYAP